MADEEKGSKGGLNNIASMMGVIPSMLVGKNPSGFGALGMLYDKFNGDDDPDKKKKVLDAAAGTPGVKPPTPGMKKGGAVKAYAKGGSVKKSGAGRGDGCAQRGRTKGKMR
jgi:hypothetical protein